MPNGGPPEAEVAVAERRRDDQAVDWSAGTSDPHTQRAEGGMPTRKRRRADRGEDAGVATSRFGEGGRGEGGVGAPAVGGVTLWGEGSVVTGVAAGPARADVSGAPTPSGKSSSGGAGCVDSSCEQLDPP